MNAAREVLEQVQILKNNLMARATGGTADDWEYQQIRQRVMEDGLLREKLPSFVRTSRTLDEFWSFIQPKFGRYADRREYIANGFESILSWLEQSSNVPMDGEVATALAKVDAVHVGDAWNKALSRRTGDPDGAVTAARALAETVCKHILDDHGVTYAVDEGLPKLYYLAASELQLAPSQQAEEKVKQILGGLQQVVAGVGRLRSELGDAHGKGVDGLKADQRIATLAINAAGALALFLVETWEQE